MQYPNYIALVNFKKNPTEFKGAKLKNLSIEEELDGLDDYIRKHKSSINYIILCKKTRKNNRLNQYLGFLKSVRRENNVGWELISKDNGHSDWLELMTLDNDKLSNNKISVSLDYNIF